VPFQVASGDGADGEIPGGNAEVVAAYQVETVVIKPATAPAPAAGVIGLVPQAVTAMPATTPGTFLVEETVEPTEGEDRTPPPPPPDEENPWTEDPDAQA